MVELKNIQYINIKNSSCIAQRVQFGALWWPRRVEWGQWSRERGYMSAAAAKSLHLCPTLCDPIDGSPPGYPVPGILQARTLEWVAISFSNALKWKVKVKSLSVRFFETPWTAAYQAPPSMGGARQEYWSGVPLPSPDICIHMADSQCCAAETNITFKGNYIPIPKTATKGKHELFLRETRALVTLWLPEI